MIWVVINHYKFILIGAGVAIVAVFVLAYVLESRFRHKALLKSQKFCRKCGKPLPSGQEVCPSCRV